MSDTNELFRRRIDDYAAQGGISVAAVFRLAGKHGIELAWIKERYYQRAAVKPGDLERLELLQVHLLDDAELDDSDPSSSARHYQERIQELSWGIELLRKSVTKMCLECADPDPGEQGYCWLASCPLRRVSPLPLAPRE